MAKIGTAFLDVKADLSGFNREIDRQTKGTTSKFSGLGRSAAAGFGVGLAGAAVAIKGFADAAIDAQKSQARMETQLKASGISFKAHGKEIDSVIQKVSKLSGLDDEDLQDSFTNIIRTTGSVSESLKLTGLAADFARAKHMDVAKAGEIVAKVAGGNTGILSRYGIQIDKGASSTEALGKLQEKFAGQAKAYGDTTAGSQDRFRVAVENLQEAMGQKLLPVIAKVADGAAGLIDGIGKLAEKNDLVVPALAAFGAALTAAAGAQVALNLAVLANPYVAAGAAIVALGVALVVAYKKSESFREIVDKVGESLSGFADAAKAIWHAFGDDVEKVLGGVEKYLEAHLKAVVKTFQGISDFVGGVFSGDWARAWNGVKETFGGAWDEIVAQLRFAWSTISGVVGAALTALKAVLGTAWSAITSAASAAWGGIRDAILVPVRAARDAMSEVVTGIANRLASGWTTIKTAVAAAWEAIRSGILTPIRAARDAMGDVVDGIGNRLSAGWTTIKSTVTSAWEAVRSGILTPIRAARDALEEVMTGILNRVGSGLSKVTTAVENFGKGVAGKISDGVKGGLNKVVDLINGIIGLINKIPFVPNVDKISHLARGGLVDDQLPGFARGGVVHHDAFAQGGEISRPMVVVGEEAPKHPEYVIPTNPAYRGRAVGLFGDLGKKLNVPGFASGGILGGNVDTSGVPSWIDPKWFINAAVDWVKGKIGSLLGIFDTTADLSLDKVASLKAMVDRMNEIASHNYPYSYGGGHSGFGPSSDIRGTGAFGYDCSGLVSAILAAGGLAFSPMDTVALQSYGQGGDGQFVTIGVRGGAGLNGHTMMKLGNRYLESGSGHGAQWVNGWAGDFPIHRHPVGFKTGGVLDKKMLPPDLLKTLPLGDQGIGWGLAKGGVVGPYVGSYKVGGTVPQDGFAYVHAGEQITPAGQSTVIYADFYAGNEKIAEMVEGKLREQGRQTAAQFRAGGRR